jgi:segregation and condensation protein B
MSEENRLRDVVGEDLLPAPPLGAESAPPPRAAAEAELLGNLFSRAAEKPAKPLALPPGASLAGAIEALLLVANEPLSAREIADVLEDASLADVRGAIHELRERYAREPRGFDLAEVAGGWRLLTRPEYAPWVSRLENVRREERLTKAQLESLAVIAYRQPILRADVDSVRGVDSGGAIRALVEKGLVKVVGRSEALGRPLLYGTTDRFLEQFGLRSLKDLPRPRPEP